MNNAVNQYSLGDTIWLISSLLGIILVLVLAYFGSRWVAKKAGTSANGSQIRIVDKAMLGQDKYLMVVKVGEKFFLLGVSGQNINMLTELDGKDFENMMNTPSQMEAISFKDIFDKAKDMSSKVRSNKNDRKI